MNGRVRTPRRWLNCPPIASSLILDKFLAFKTPLNKKFTGSLKEKEFTVSSVFDYLEGKQLKMGLWIDLSVVNRFPISEVKSRGCQYVKTPNIEQIMTLVRNFIENNPNEIIGIHCTHGMNRTGFVIVCIMVEVYNWEWRKGVEEFKKARPPGICRQFIIDEISKRYDTPGVSIAPPTQINMLRKGKERSMKQEAWRQVYISKLCHAKGKRQESDETK